MVGRVHSIETTGMVDGPGIRYVVFVQGCLMRCQFCHNPDTWDRTGGQVMNSETLFADLLSYLPYYTVSGGGLTVSGGEPLLQADFVKELFEKCRSRGIHTALDTTGIVWNEDVESLLQVTDLILLDLKEMNPEKHRDLTGVYNSSVLQFAERVAERNIPVWIRHVMVPGLTDHPDSLDEMGAFIQAMPNVERVELLPFHKMGEYKWSQLGIPYRLSDVEPPAEEVMRAAYRRLTRYISATKFPEMGQCV
ncbi:pyruvate formate-lyase-activating protein [Aneurinibacillus terranovensis]|uniref:pyruvate formate-lyase-activating protein n=1 Tax=Aneurinibacillus terranovensis TaxID=278991 RepID=UPI0003F568B3|nr:pyruvate formate-lyase-activating protein [Aneurinibacillus terranovensis]